ncbi:dephospho-CoA kinase [bacterium]|nr:MAG: dephospho-CoA kinase [bacterium]
MMRWVVTGPAGAGKSLFTAALADLGAAVVDGDKLGHEILARPEVAARVAESFGAEMVAHGVVDRCRLGNLVFQDPGALAKLDSLTHEPLSVLMEERLAACVRPQGPPLAVLDAAVYFLLPSPPTSDLVILVDAPAELRIARLVQRTGLAPAVAGARVTAQQGMSTGWQRADLTVTNDGTPSDLQHAARRIWMQRGPGINDEPKD